MKRRQFIKNTVIGASLFPLLNNLASCRFSASNNQRKLILIQLVGGNDGLNTLIPIDKYEAIQVVRPNLFIPERKVLKLKDTLSTGLHPSMSAIQEMYNHGLISFVQGVGYENQNYSHFRSQDIWLSGSKAEDVLYTGWIARYLETKYKNYPVGFPNNEVTDPIAIKVGEMGSFVFQGTSMDVSVIINPSMSNFDTEVVNVNASSPNGYARNELRKIRDILIQTGKYSQVVNDALMHSFKHSALYPEKGKNPLADQLKIVAKLINGGLDTAIYHVDLKGFDTHSAQVDHSDTTKGAHANLLAQLSQAVNCFWDDISKMGREKEIAGFAFSEFGRRIISNSAYGTDHGAAQPLMFFGGMLNEKLIGKNPEIPMNADVLDNLTTQFDFKDIYKTIIVDWLNDNADNLSVDTHINLFKK